MWLNELWQRWMGRMGCTRRQRRRQRTQTRTRTHLTVERLEDRTVFSINLVSNYAGLNFGQSVALQGGSGSTPPDTNGAAGSNSYVETVNESISIDTKATGTPMAQDSLDDFFLTRGGLTNPTGSSAGVHRADAVVVYDDNMPGQTAANGRFIVGEQDVDDANHVSAFFLAVSKTSDPATLTSDDWNFFQITTTENGGSPNSTWDADYPGNLGFNHSAFVFTLNMFADGTQSDHVQVDSVDMSALTAVTPTLRVYQNDFNGFSLRPTTMHDDTETGASDPMWLIQEHNGGDGANIDVVKMTNVLSNSAAFATTTLAVDPYRDIVSGGYGGPFQPDGTQPTSFLDSRILKASEADNTIVATQQVTDSAPSTVTGKNWDRDLARWYVIDVSSGTPTLSDQGDVTSTATGAGQANAYDMYPGIDINSAGDIGMSFMQSSYTASNAGQYVSMYVTGRTANDPAGTMETPVLIPSGTGLADYSDFDGGRLGDLSGINVDPSDGSFWAANEFADDEPNGRTGAANWGTAFANFTVGTGSGGTITCTAANVADLIACINEANADPADKYIIQLTSSTYDLTAVNNTTNGANGLPVITSPNLTIESTVNGGSTIERDTIGVGLRFFDVANGASLTLDNLTLHGGDAFGSGTTAEGGAIYSSGTLKLSNVTVTRDSALATGTSTGGNGVNALGGGIFVAGGSATLTNDTLKSNTVLGAGQLARFPSLVNGGSGLGGGMYVAAGTVTLTNDIFSNNFAGGGDGENGGKGGSGSGGGLFVAEGKVTLTNVNISGNVARGGYGGNGIDGGSGGTASGGGIFVAAGTTTLTDDTLRNNEAQGRTGGFGSKSGGSGSDAFGGGLYWVGSTVTLNADIFSGNNAQGGNGGSGGAGEFGGRGGNGGNASGGGLYWTTGTVTLKNDNLTNNRAQGGDGGAGGQLIGHNGRNISGVGGSGGDAFGGGLYGPDATLNYDTLSGNTAQAGNGGMGGNARSNGTGAADGGNGGSGGYAQGGGLYLIAGIDTLTDDTLSQNTAQGGNGGNGGTASNQGGLGGNSGSAAGGGLYVATFSYLPAGNVVLANDTLSRNKGQGGVGGNGGNALFGGNGGNGNNAFGGGLLVVGGNGTSFALTDDILSLNSAWGGAGGNGGIGIGYGGNGGDGGKAGSAFGGGLDIFAGSPTLTNDTLSSNSARGGNGGGGGNGSSKGGNGGVGGNGAGGGLYLTGGLTLIDATLSSNVAVGGFGGAAKDTSSRGSGGNGGAGGSGFGGGLYLAKGSATLTNDTLADNSAYGMDGGEAFHLNSAYKGGNGGNGGNASGGGLYVASGSANLTNDTLVKNNAYGMNGGTAVNYSGKGGNGGNASGGGLYIASGSATTLANTLIAQNVASEGFGAAGAVNGTNGTADGPDVSGAVTSSDHDLIGDTSGSSGFSTANGDILNPTNAGLDPNGLQGNGGPLVGAPGSQQIQPTIALVSGSPAIDAGDSNAAPSATDERGYARIVGSGIDIGAFEYGATPATTDLAVRLDPPVGVPAGGQIYYRLTVTNNGSTAQSKVTISDVLPTNTTLVSWTVPSGWSHSAPATGSGSGTVSAWVASLAAGASANFTLALQVVSGTAAGTVITNTAAVGPITGDPNPDTNSVTFNTTVVVPVSVSDVSVTRSGFRYDFVHHEFVQTITITNTSGSALYGPLALQLTNLSTNATLANADGADANGNPFIDFLSAGQSLAADQSITVTLYFKDPTFQAITYGTQVMQNE